ncbi:hypothetical protein PV08_10755 [Exophiala spinifera]|uniref:C2H2-type domain-containing protein n=1 Tax=Exophiala spinifera TaxID=91928 RepID=A0A0D2AYI8_9EURO|nr:uncharacterized protein PV08_10755 [Exophiala spinifera]KIW11455.1 hypothetical protein PV08_10755 [Exophiala spinifera]
MVTPDLARLASLGRKNFALLEQVIGGFKSGLLEDAHARNHCAFLNEYERYRVWAVESGLLAPGHGSLDYRLRESGTLTELFELILNGLAQNLEETLELGRSRQGGDQSRERLDAVEPHSDDPDCFEDEEEGELEPQSYIDILLEVIVGLVNRLFKLSTKIRNTSTRLGFSRAKFFESIDKDTGVDLIKAFAHYDDDYVRSVFLQYRLDAPEEIRSQEAQDLSSMRATETLWHQTETCELCQSRGSIPEGSTISGESQSYEDAEEDSPEDIEQLQHQIGAHYLVHRIAQANNKRRQQFGYWKEHYSKLQKHTETVLATIRPRTLAEPDRHLQPAAVDGFERELNSRQTLGISALLAPPTVTTATRLEPSLLNRMDERSVTSVSEYAPSSWAPDRENIGFPPPPKKPLGDKFFECPYCFTICPRQMLSDKAWRAHLIHDLRPFVCTYPDCQIAGQLYDTKSAWVEHENTVHRKQWRCPDHPDPPYSSLQTFEAHIAALHGSDATYLRSDTFLQACQSFSVDNDRPCPICLSSSFRDVQALQSHLSQHLIRMSLFSLPRSTDADDGRSQVGSDIAVGEVLDSRADDDENSSDGGEAWDDIAEAAGAGDTERLTNILLEKQENGLSVEVLNHALCKASAKGHTETVEILLDNGADIEAVGQEETPLMQASIENRIEVVRLLLGRGAHVNEGRSLSTALTCATEYSDIEIILELLSAGADPNKTVDDGSSAVRQAAIAGRLNVLATLMDHGADINAPSLPALPAASSRGHKEVVQLLLERGAHIDAKAIGETALMGASLGGYQEIVKTLLDHGADPNLVDNTGNTALLMVSGTRHEHVEIVKMLIDRGAHVDHTDKRGNTALHAAAARGYANVVRVLIDAGADLERANQVAVTPLQAALKARQHGVVTMLLEAGVKGTQPADPLDELILPQLAGGTMVTSKKSPPSLPRLWRIETLSSTETAPRLTLVHDIAPGSILTCVSFSPDGSYLAVAGQAVTWLVDLEDVSKMYPLPHPGSKHDGLYVRSVCFSADGKSLATASEDYIVRLWDVETREVKHLFGQHSQEVHSVAISPDNNMIASGSSDGEFYISDCITGDVISSSRAKHAVTSVAFSPDSRLLAVGTVNKDVLICRELGTGEWYNLSMMTPSPTETVYDVAFSSSGEQVFCASLDSNIYRWHFKDEGGDDLTDCKSQVLSGHNGYALSVAETRDCRWIVSGSRDKTVRIWSEESGQAMLLLEGHEDTVFSIATCPEKNLIATASGDMTFTVWRYENE